MIHLIVGNTGSGKTTYSNKLKDETRGVIFSIDKWNKTLFLPDKKQDDGLEWFLERIDRSELIMQDLIFQLEGVKTDSILDLGLSKMEHRDKFRKFAKENNIACKLHFLDIPKEIRMKRVLDRNIQKGETFEFEVSKSDFEFMEGWFEPPSEFELVNGILVKS
jgi:predicted kinase